MAPGRVECKRRRRVNPPATGATPSCRRRAGAAASDERGPQAGRLNGGSTPPEDAAARRASVAAARPSSTAAAAIDRPAVRSVARPATTIAAAAFTRAMSRRGPGSPASTDRTAAAAASTDATCSDASVAVARPSSAGFSVQVVIVAVPQLRHPRRAHRADLVQPVVGVDDPGPLAAQLGQDGRHRLGQLGGEHAQQLVAGPAGVGQRAEQVEHGRHAQRRPHGRHAAHGRVVAAGEGEADAGRGQAPVGRAGQVDAEPLQHVGRAGVAAGAAVAVLDDGHATGGGDDRGHGRDVERAADVAAGAAGVEDGHAGRDRHPHGPPPQGGGGPGQLGHGQALGREADQQARRPGRRWRRRP